MGDQSTAAHIEVALRTKRHRRSWGQRLMLTMNILACLACFVGAAGLLYARSKDRIQRVQGIEVIPVEGEQLDTDDPNVSGSVDTLPEASGEVGAQNWLLTGSDARDCIDPNSPYAGAFLGEDVGGERSDTIMVLRFDPATNFVAALSFPRDLYVKIGKGSRQGKINSAYDGENPNRLIQTIFGNFGVPINHWADINFCAFKELVDAVGGVKLQFAFPTRDRNTGLNVPVAECHAFTGEEALAYVRSRHYEFTEGDRDSRGRLIWKQDQTGDIGRVRRQQEFLRAVAQRALDTGITNPRRFDDILDAFGNNTKTDDNVTNDDLVQLALRLVRVDPATMQTYVVQANNAIVGEESVLKLPRGGDQADYNETVYRIFRGEALPEDFVAVSASSTVAPSDPAATTTGVAGVPDPAAVPSEATVPGALEGEVVVAVPDVEYFGILPDPC